MARARFGRGSSSSLGSTSLARFLEGLGLGLGSLTFLAALRAVAAFFCVSFRVLVAAAVLTAPSLRARPLDAEDFLALGGSTGMKKRSGSLRVRAERRGALSSDWLLRLERAIEGEDLTNWISSGLARQRVMQP